MTNDMGMSASQINAYSIMQYETDLVGEELRTRWAETQRNYRVKTLLEEMGVPRRAGALIYCEVLLAYCEGFITKKEYERFMMTRNKEDVPAYVLKIVAEMSAYERANYFKR